MNEILSIRITKRGGEEMGGVWLSLPSTLEQFKAVLNELGMKEAVQRDIFISDYRTSIALLDNASLIKNADLNELNYLAARLAAIEPIQLKKLEAIGESPHHLNSIAQMIDYTYNTDYFVLTTGVHSAEELGHYCLYQSREIEMPEAWKSVIDTAALGQRIYELEKGTFTSQGYLELSGDEWQANYHTGNIPARYRLFNYLAAAEMSMECNYNQIDGTINNEGPLRADLTDGQTWDEIDELAPGTKQKQEKPSILGQLAQSKEDAANRPAPAKNHQRGNDRDL